LIDDIYVQFEENDLIFDLAKEIDKEFMEATEGPDAATTCACCNKPQTKMKNCQFCGTVNCSQCLCKTRPYPKENPTKDRRGAICLPCNKKFLFREVKHELTIKLEIKDNKDAGDSSEQLQEEMEREDLNYNRLLNDLRNQKELKYQQLEQTREKENQNS
jgi:hypothetical protein